MSPKQKPSKRKVNMEDAYLFERQLLFFSDDMVQERLLTKSKNHLKES